MTYSLVGMCGRTGMLGAAVTTSSGAVGSRCPYARAGVGAVLTQHRTDPRLGPKGLDLLEAGKSAAEVITELTRDDPTIGWRQLAVIDNTGTTAFFHGERIKSVHAESQGTDCCAIGNIIRNTEIPGAMTAAFEANPEEHLAERLLRALEAGDDAGGEFRQIKSAALLVVHKEDFAYVDLRVDLDRDPLAQLRYHWEFDKPMLQRYVDRVIDPDSVPYPEV
jgi:uncharacterized Ntn-hydrolase superfamily protein